MQDYRASRLCKHYNQSSQRLLEVMSKNP
uniref:Uncharacterized protein n=1 Tax=Rhizophora mucronata TaxID=61149 RepID=A0A2P2NRK6_RHIMU